MQMRHPTDREVLDCGSPLPLFGPRVSSESGRGLPQSKTLARSRRRAAVSLLLCTLAALPATGIAGAASSGPATNAHLKSDVVVLLHGLGRTRSSMKGVEWALTKQGYRVVNIGYPSLRMPLERLADEHLHAALASQVPDGALRVHFVTHSFGGILLRHYLAGHSVPNLGRVVMLAPPNHGSEVVTSLRKSPFVRWFAGPNFLRLGTGPEDSPQRLAPVDFELGVIAGDRSFNPWFSALLDGPDDGKVSVASTRVEGMKDFLVVHSSHVGLKWRGETQRQIARFLERGRFGRE